METPLTHNLLRGDSHGILQCFSCGTVLRRCECPGSTMTPEYVMSCRTCFSLTPYEAAQVRRQANPRLPDCP